MDWDLSCRDWETRLREGRSLVPDLPLWQPRAEKAVRIFNRLRIPDVPGTPTFAEAGGDWFRDMVAALHGSLDQATMQRMIREIFCLVPKKNAKTTGGAGLMVTSVLMSERPRAEFLIVAPTQQVAALAFNQAAGMIDLDAHLSKRFHVQSHLKKMTYRPTGATLQIRSFDPGVMTGVKPAGILVDEEHVIADNANADRVMGQIRGGMVSQPEAFLVIITTQSERQPKGVFKADLQMARSVRDGKAQASLLPILYEFPEAIAAAAQVQGEAAPWEDTSLWHMVTPNRGLSITVERLIPDYEKAKLAGDGELRRWASQHLNIEIGLGLRSGSWAGADLWEAAAEPEITFQSILDTCEVVVVGVDGGGADDLFGLAVLGREKDTLRWKLWVKCWAQRLVLHRRKQIAAELTDFERDGELTLFDTPGPEVEEIADLIAQIDEAGLLASVGLDPMGIGEVVDALAERGIEGNDRVVGIQQGWKLNASIKTVERKLANGTLVHAGQPIMAWAVGNAKAEARGNAVAIDKAAAGSAKIDPLVATFNAVALMSRNPEAKLNIDSFLDNLVIA